ncbi:MAG: hypothetical protein Q8P41_28790 [Pseudomonadota bacterium]|nr:hypothetical protein [Pseudomonadota bacterium]
MRFSLTEAVAFPRERVFRFQRDRMPELLSDLRSVASVETLEVHVDGPRMRGVKRWTGATAGLPASVVGLFPANAFQWVDTSTWDESDFSVTWGHRHERWPDAMRARGTNRFEANGEDTLLSLDGELTLYPERVPGVPAAVGEAVRPLLERLVVAQLRATLRDTLALVAERLERE